MLAYHVLVSILLLFLIFFCNQRYRTAYYEVENVVATIIIEFIVNYPDIVEKLITSINVNDNEDQTYDVKYRVAFY